MPQIIQKLIPEGKINRPAIPMDWEFITLHDTTNTELTANAAAHARYLQTIDSKVSWHLTVDDKEIYQHLPFNETAYHAGDGSGPGNRKSIGIERCECSASYAYRDAVNILTIELVVWLLKQKQFGTDRVKPHKYWSGKNCPHLLLSWWGGFLALIEEKLNYAQPKTQLVGKPQIGFEQAMDWARSRNATEEFINIAKVYWQLAPIFSIRPEVAYAQSAKETGFGRFGGVIDKTFHNWCGLKIPTGGSCSDPNAHQRFINDEAGVLAHIQHLCAYAGIDIIVDPRYHLVSKGVAQYVEDLGGRWAPSDEYGKSIVNDYLTTMLV
jgi:hypothetical protein